MTFSFCDSPLLAQTVQLDPIPEKQVIQRVDGVGSLVLSGTTSGSVATVEARVVEDGSGQVVLPWSPVAQGLSGNTWSGTLQAIPEGGWYRVEARAAGIPGAAVATSPRFGVGLVVLCLGQSNIARFFTEDAADGSLSGPPEQPHGLTWRLGYGEPPGYDYERPAIDLPVTRGPVTGSGGIRFANALQEATGVPVLVLDYALDWTGLEAHWNEGAGPFVGWQKVVDGLATVDGLGAVVWLQGTYEAITQPESGSVEATKAALDTLHSRLVAASGVSELPLVVSLLNRGDYTDDTLHDAAFDRQRRAQTEWVDQHPWGFAAGGAFDLELSTRAAAGLGHFWASGYATLGDRWARGVLHALGKTAEESTGPRLTGARRDGRTLVLDVVHTAGSRLLLPDPLADIDGFQVTQGAWGVDDLAIERAVLSSQGPDNRIVLTLAQAPSASLRIRFLAGQNTNRQAPTLQQRRGRGNWPTDDVAYGAGRLGFPLAPTVTDLLVTEGLATNAPPAATPDQGWVATGGTLTLDLLANDLDPEGALDPSSVRVLSPPTHGTIVAIDPLTGVVTYQQDGAGEGFLGDAFTYDVADAAGNPSAPATVTLEPLDAAFPALGGRVLHLEADRGLATNGGMLVTRWNDLSGRGNHVLPAGDPTRIDGALNGEDCIRFDGLGDKLERVDALTDLPALDQDRTVFVVAQYRSTGFGGVAWGSPSNGDCANRGNQVFGLIVDPQGRLTVQAWCNDFPSDSAGTGEGWLVQSAIHQAGELRHFKNGTLIDTRRHTFATDALGTLTLGAELDSSPFLDMDLALVLVYDRALSDAEHGAVESYLQQKYLTPQAAPPTAVGDAGVFEPGGSVVLDVLANDHAAEGIDPTSVRLVALPANGNATVDPVDGTITYQHDGSATEADALVYTVDDFEGRTSNPATVALTRATGILPSEGRVLHLESDSGVTTVFGDEVSQWLDQSPRGNSVSAAGGPFLDSGVTPSGADAIVFDGGNDRLERLTGLDGLPTGDDDRTVLTVVRYRSDGFGGITWGSPQCNRIFGPVVDHRGNLASQGWCAGNDVSTQAPGNGAGWRLHTLVHEASVLRQYADGVLVDTTVHAFDTDGSGRLVLGAEIDNFPHIAMDLAAVVVYDRALSELERLSAEALLRDKYLGPSAGPEPTSPTALDDTATGEVGGLLVLDVLANDVPGSGPQSALDPTSVTVVDPPTAGSLVLDPSTGTLTYQHDGGTTLVDSWRYTVANLAGLTSNAATVSLTLEPAPSGDALPGSGRVLHLESDQGLSEAFGDVVAWADQSAGNNHLSAAGGPRRLTRATPTGQDAVTFDGGNDRLERLSDLTGLPTGNDDRTVLAVVRYSSNGFGGITWGAPGCNQVFGPIVDAAGNLAVQGWCLGNDAATTSPANGQGWLLHTVVHRAGQLEQYRDGLLIDQRAHTFDTASGGRLILGAEIDNFPHIAMDVAAVVIYDRALSSSARRQAETFLTHKYLVPPPPTAVDDQAAVDHGGSRVVPVLANDLDGDGAGSLVALDPASLALVTPPAHGQVVIDPTGGTMTYTHDGSATTLDAWTYTVRDTLGQRSNLATVHVTIAPEPGTLPITGLVLHLDSELGVELGLGEVNAWLDQSPRGNDVVGIGGPRFAEGITPGGAPALLLDGSNDRFERLSGLDGLPSGADDRSLFVAVRYLGPGFGGVGWGSAATDCATEGNRAFSLGVTDRGDLSVLGYCSGNDFPVAEPGPGADWMIHSATVTDGVLRHFRDGQVLDQRRHDFATDGTTGRLILGAEIDGFPAVAMELAAVVVYDRALGEAERSVVEDVLQQKFLGRAYNNPPPLAVDDALTGLLAGTIALDVLANDLDEGTLDPSTLTILNPPQAGDVQLDPATGQILYSHTAGLPAATLTDSFTYRVHDALGQPSTPATVTLALLPVADGLVLHLDPAVGVFEEPGDAGQPDAVLAWLDLSGHRNDLVALGNPERLPDPLAGHPVVRFDGSGDWMVNAAPLVGLPDGASDRTVILVVDYRSRGFGGLTWGSTRCNEVFGPVVDHRGRLAVQGYCNDFSTSRNGNGVGWQVQTVVLANDLLTHYTDGVLVDSTVHTFDTDGAGTLSLAAEIDGAPQVTLDLATALVFDRALDDLERQTLEDFLIDKLLEN